MAVSKEYAYYLEGNQLAIVEKDVNFDNNVNNKEYGPGVARQQWKSPLTTVADALEVKYVYSPKYRIDNLAQVDTDDISTYYSNGAGKLTLGTTIGSANFTNGTNVTNMSAINHIVLENAGKFNGYHKVSSVATTSIVTDTPYVGSTNPTNFEESVSMYYTVSVLEDESFELDLPSYLQKALVYYIKAKMFEDNMDINGRDYAMREFKKMVEKYESTRISGMRMISSGPHAIR
tara:strand:+ start:3099 stop:3797 length:699 start_codon:yes stop_codon:yes gene_type:complete